MSYLKQLQAMQDTDRRHDFDNQLQKSDRDATRVDKAIKECRQILDSLNEKYDEYFCICGDNKDISIHLLNISAGLYYDIISDEEQSSRLVHLLRKVLNPDEIVDDTKIIKEYADARKMAESTISKAAQYNITLKKLRSERKQVSFINFYIRILQLFFHSL